MHEDPGHGRPEGGGRSRRGTPDTDGRGAALGRGRIQDDAEARRQDQGGPGSLHEPRDDERGEARRERARQRREREERDAEKEDPLTAEHVGQAAGGREERSEEDRVARDHPRERGDRRRWEVALDRGEGEVDDGHVEEVEECGSRDEDEDLAVAGRGGVHGTSLQGWRDLRTCVLAVCMLPVSRLPKPAFQVLPKCRPSSRIVSEAAIAWPRVLPCLKSRL